MLGEVRALVTEGCADTSENRVVRRRDGIAEGGAAEHHVGCRFHGGPTRASAVLFSTPLYKFGHRGELPGYQANAGLDNIWWQVLKGAPEHVARVVPAAQEVCSIRWGSMRAAVYPKLTARELPNGHRGEGQEAGGASFNGALRQCGGGVPLGILKDIVPVKFRQESLVRGKGSALLRKTVGGRIKFARVVRADLSEEGSRAGLSAGQEAIEAALNPASGDWLYFVTVDPDTLTTKFTADYDQFLAWKQKFRETYAATAAPQAP